ncbi:hypothetical protein [Solimicrobium silvestre]|uniref:Uncharacterized protein n=1 Tax=Solimicrobium silvestre TaxID=2099400 RepID=A0A2S9H2Y9_9BURK|nr:hypothetical protein [Solimicrobium silvestre]PRC94338.1 hypothetical protein S2091_0959 [Solimicrobium silvestre]
MNQFCIKSFSSQANQKTSTLCTYLTLVLCLFLAGCYSNPVKDTIDHAIQTESRCNAIQEAIPVGPKEQTGKLFDALSVRLVGTCLNACDKKTDENLSLDASEYTKENLEAEFKKQIGAVSANNQSNAEKFDVSVENINVAFGQLVRDFEQLKNANGAVKKQLTGLREVAINGDTTLNNCKKRSDCMMNLAEVLQTDVVQFADLQKSVSTLQESLKKVSPDLVALNNQLTKFKFDYQAPGMDTLIEEYTKLSTTINGLDARLENGKETLERLSSKDFEGAASDLMAFKVYNKVAARMLTVIDGMLSQADHAIDKVDERFFGAINLAVYLEQDKLQKQFDHIFNDVINKGFPTNTAKLAFASAACEKMGLGTADAAQNRSMFTPFLYETLINVQIDLAKDGPLTGDARESALKEAKEKDKSGDTYVNTILSEASDAYVSDIKNNKAPAMVDQVALCSAIEEALTLSNGKDVNTLSVVRQACGQAIVSAIVNKTSNLADSQQAIKAAAAQAASQLDADSAIFKSTLDKVLAAIPKPDVKPDPVCDRIVASVNGTHCTNLNGQLIIEFDASFALGATYDNAIEMNLFKLANVLNLWRYNYSSVHVEGYASHAPPVCSKNLPDQKTRLKCENEKNEAIAKNRAIWAQLILGRRLISKPANISAHGTVDSLSFDAAIDRHIRITLENSSTSQK